MATRYIEIEDFFNEDVESNSEVQAIRQKINSFRTYEERNHYIYNLLEGSTQIQKQRICSMFNIDPSLTVNKATFCKDRNSNEVLDFENLTYQARDYKLLDKQEEEAYQKALKSIFGEDKYIEKKSHLDDMGDLQENKDGESYKEKVLENSKLYNKGSIILYKIKRVLIVTKWPVIIIACLLALDYIFLHLVPSAFSNIGMTPFEICENLNEETSDVSTSIAGTDSDFTKSVEVDGHTIKMPLALNLYDDYEENSNGTPVSKSIDVSNYSGDDSERGKGVMVEEDFNWGVDCGVNVDTDFVVVARWEYVNLNVYAFNGAYDGVPFRVGPGSFSSYGNYISSLANLKVLVINNDNGKSCICSIGAYPNGNYNANWGPAPVKRYGGATHAVFSYLEATPGFGGSNLEFFFVNPSLGDIATGPYEGTFTTGISKTASNNVGCNVLYSSTGLGSIASCAVSMSVESKKLSETEGEELYIQKAGEYGFTAKCCAGFVSTVIKTVGCDPDFKGSDGTDTLAKELFNSDKWEVIGVYNNGLTVNDLMPGDVLITRDESLNKINNNSHAIIYAGNEEVRKKFPNNDGVFCAASLGERYAGCYPTDSWVYTVFRFKG